MAHRDDTGAGPGANDNASGTGALIELARLYYAGACAPTCRGPFVPLAQDRLPLDRRRRNYGALGADRFARTVRTATGSWPWSTSTAIAAHGRRESRSRAARPGRRPTLVATAAAESSSEARTTPRRTGPAGQLVDLRLSPDDLRARGLRRPRGLRASRSRRAPTAETGFEDTPERLTSRCREPATRARPCRRESRRLARRERRLGEKAPSSDLFLGAALRPGLEPSSSSDRLPATVPRRRGRPLRALPAPSRSGLVPAVAEPAQPPRFLGSRGRRAASSVVGRLA